MEIKEAQKIIKKHLIKKPEAKCLAAVKRLPAKLRTIGYFFLDKDEKGKSLDYYDRYDMVDPMACDYEALTKAERARLTKCFVPSLVAEVELTYQFRKSQPIGGHYEALVYRSEPDSQEALLNGFRWVERFLTSACEVEPKTLTPVWLATWLAYIHYSTMLYPDNVCPLLAAVIDKGGKTGDEVFEIIRQSGTREHEIAAMGSHVPQILLMASNPDGWTLIEGMLLAAQRQEGLRQSILTALETAHTDALARMLNVMRENRLVRFSAVTYAFNNWFGFNWDSASVSVVNKILDKLLEFTSNGVSKKTWDGDDGEAVYLALWTLGIQSVGEAIAQAKKCLLSEAPEVRFAAIHYLHNVATNESIAAIAESMFDKDPRVAAMAMRYFSGFDGTVAGSKADATFTALEEMLPKTARKEKQLKPILWPWITPTVSRDLVAASLIASHGDLPPNRLIPSIKLLKSYHRRVVVRKLIEQDKWNPESRAAIVKALGDSTSDVRGVAMEGFKRRKLKSEEILVVEKFLSRKSNDFRDSIINLLMKQRVSGVLESIERLLDERSGPRRLAGLELARRMAEEDRGRDKCIEMVKQWHDGRTRCSKQETSQVSAILASDQEPVTFENALGLSKPAERKKVVQPDKIQVTYMTAAARRFVQKLDDLIHEHRKVEFESKNWRGDLITSKIAQDHMIPSPNTRKPKKEQLKRLPLADVWFDWFYSRPESLQDDDGLEMFRAKIVASVNDSYTWNEAKRWGKKDPAKKKLLKTLLGSDTRMKLRYQTGIETLIDWFLFVKPLKNMDRYLLDSCENILASIPQKDIDNLAKRKKSRSYYSRYADWRTQNSVAIDYWLDPLRALEGLSKAERKRRYQLLRWFEQPIPAARRIRMPFKVLVEGYGVRAANIHDVADHMLGPRDRWDGYYTVNALTERRPDKEYAEALQEHPEIADFVDQVRARVIELELNRGEKESVATEVASQLSAVFGIDTLVRLLAGLGKKGFKKDRSWRSDTTSKAVSLTTLVSACYPDENETPKQFAKKIKDAVDAGLFPEERVIQLAFQAPQWILFVEEYLQWDGFSEGTYWFLAHMKYVWGGFDDAAFGTEFDDDEPTGENYDDFDDDSYDFDDESMAGREKLSPWDRLILQRTALTDSQRYEGCVDVQWFQRTRTQLSNERWDAMAAAARYAATSAQAKRASYIAAVLTGRADRAELIEKLQTRKLKENVRLLGLFPLAKGRAGEKDVLERYEILQEYRRYARTLSGLTKPDALRASDIGFENLSRTAGYPDPLRLQWAMEAKTTKDLRRGYLQVKKDDVTVRMDLDAKCMPIMTIKRGDRKLKSIPRSHRKDPDMLAIRERAKEIKKQSRRSRRSLEVAMCRRDTFAGKELDALADHHLIWPMLSRLVIVGEGIMGYPDKGGKALRDHSGKLEPVKASEQLRIAHPYDLLKSKDWPKWQQDCFTAERVQPFKQIFRELYVVTSQERQDKTSSSRYAGQQINPKQAFALWGSRGWHTRDEIWKAFPNEEMAVSVDFEWAPGSPGEVEGLTVDQIQFRKRDSYAVIKLTSVDPIVFSEVMRDIDLVVSVAHRGEVDPEASASTVEVRTKLIEQTCSLLGIKNVKTKANHATIKGELGEYSLHLGSGLVHRMPGGHVCIVPIHSQHRGRLFLPFADDDPKTAEVVSKVLLLARDDEIDDPTILDQLRAAGAR